MRKAVFNTLVRAFGDDTAIVVEDLTRDICAAFLNSKQLKERIGQIPTKPESVRKDQPTETKAEMVDRLRQKIVGNLSLRDFFYNYLLSQDNEDEVSKRLSDYGNYRDKLSKIDSEMNRSSFWSRIAILSSQIAMGQKTFAIAEQEYRGATVQRDIPTPQVATDSSDDAVVGLLKGLNDNGGDS